MMRPFTERPGLVFVLVFAWKVALLIFTAQPIPANDSFFYDGPVVNYLLHGKYINPSLALALPIAGNEVFSAYPPLYQLVLLGWMSVFGTSALSAMWLHVLLFGVYELILLAIFRRLRTPALCVNLAGLFLLAITFQDRPDSLAHVLGMGAVYACVRSRRSLGGETQNGSGSCWTWITAALTVLTLSTSLQMGAVYLFLVWLMMLANSLLTKERFPIAAMAASVLIPIGLVAVVAFGWPHLWAGFLEHASITPSATGLRLPRLTNILKVIRSVPGVFAVALLLSWLRVRRNHSKSSSETRFWLLTGACTATALAVVIACLSVVTASMVQIATYLQPLAVGGFLALMMTRGGGVVLPRCYTAVFVGLALVTSIRAIGMTTWGAACASDVTYRAAQRRLREELKATSPRSTVVVSSAYLYETARHDDLRWIHSDWPGKTDFSSGTWERDSLVALKPAKLIVTQFDYYRRYHAVMVDFERRPELVKIKIKNTATIPPPDSIDALQKVVQHISWAPVVVEFTWR